MRVHKCSIFATVAAMRSSQDLALLRALAAEVKSLRAVLEISQDELAHRAGLARTFVGKIEIAKNQPSLTALFKLAQGLGILPQDLIAAVGARYKRELRAQRARER